MLSLTLAPEPAGWGGNRGCEIQARGPRLQVLPAVVLQGRASHPLPVTVWLQHPPPSAGCRAGCWQQVVSSTRPGPPSSVGARLVIRGHPGFA